MEPTLWGPGLWHLLFSIAWQCHDKVLPDLLRVILYHVPTLLPCQQCQDHYVRNHLTLRKRHGEPTTACEAFVWLYHLKDAVNKSLHTPSISLADLRQRYRTFGARLDDVLVADTLLLVAIGNEDQGNDDVFIEFCRALANLLPLPDDSELVWSMQKMRKPVVSYAFRACKNTRKEHGIPFPSLKHVLESLS